MLVYIAMCVQKLPPHFSHASKKHEFFPLGLGIGTQFKVEHTLTRHRALTPLTAPWVIYNITGKVNQFIKLRFRVFHINPIWVMNFSEPTSIADFSLGTHWKFFFAPLNLARVPLSCTPLQLFSQQYILNISAFTVFIFLSTFNKFFKYWTRLAIIETHNVHCDLFDIFPPLDHIRAIIGYSTAGH